MAGEGEIEFSLNGKAETLKSTLRAAKIVSANAGGFQGVLSKLALMEFEAYVGVVSAGLARKPSEVEEAVYKTGLPNLTEPLTEYVMLLANGGKPMSSGEDSGKGEA